MLSEKSAIKIKVEAVKGTEIEGDQAVYVEDLVINPTGEFINREGTGLFLGPDTEGVIGGRMGKCTFTTELKTDGSQALEAGLAILLQACGFVKAVEVYSIATFAEQKTISIDVYQDGVIKTLFGAMGTFTMEAEEGKRVLFNFDFDGLYKAEADIALPAYAPTGNVIMWGNGTFTVLTESHLISKFSLDMDNNVVPKHNVTGPGGVAYAMISIAHPTAGWDAESDLIANDDVHADWLAGVTGTLALAVGDGTDTVTIDCAKVQYTDIPEGERNNLRIHDLTVQCLQVANSTDMVQFTVT